MDITKETWNYTHRNRTYKQTNIGILPLLLRHASWILPLRLMLFPLPGQHNQRTDKQLHVQALARQGKHILTMHDLWQELVHVLGKVGDLQP